MWHDEHLFTVASKAELQKVHGAFKRAGSCHTSASCLHLAHEQEISTNADSPQPSEMK